MLYFAYLDEFGHIGPYVSRADPRYNDSPVFGLGGVILPYGEVRSFATWFFQLKCNLLAFEIRRDGANPATWEKKGSALYTTKNVETYRELRSATNRYLNKLHAVGGAVFYTGIQKRQDPGAFSPQRLYLATLARALRQLDAFAAEREAQILIVMDEHQDRDAILTAASQAMYRAGFARRRIVEPPFQVESHRYQTCQCADWVCGLVGRIGAFQASPGEYPELAWTERFFTARIARVAVRSGLRLQPTTSVAAAPVAGTEDVAAVLAGSDDAPSASGPESGSH